MKNTINMKNIFSSKADVLDFLYNKITKARIEKMDYFSVHEWKKQSEKILESISNNFNSEFVIIRSSAIGEDSIIKSEAGNYLSIQNVDSTSKKQLKSAISEVIKSFSVKGNKNSMNQVLVQKQTVDVITSGVIFTKTISTGSPYYVINFDDGTNTDTVTKGEIGNIFKIFRFLKLTKIPKKWRKLIIAVKEIEKIIGIENLDIEFGINKKRDIIIFQVRPLTSIKTINSHNLKNNLSKQLEKNRKKFLKYQKSPFLLGKKTIFSDMCDWNPAEIIGDNPNLLDYSLYDYLIMKKIWSQSRSILGYTNAETSSLMKKFGQKPFVDVRASFNSFLPNEFSKKLKQKLIMFYLKKLIKNPHLHDNSKQ